MVKKEDYRLIMVVTVFIAISIWLANRLKKDTIEITNDMSNLKLTNVQRTNMSAILSSIRNMGVTNTYAQAAMLAVISKESGFIPRSENLSYSAGRIGVIWPRLKSQAKSLERNPKALGNAAYGHAGNTLGNNQPGDGYKYRGRGFNQLTGRGNYRFHGNRIGVDLVASPDLVNKPKIAAAVFVSFYQVGFDKMPASTKQYYGVSSFNDFTDPETAALCMYHINTGSSKSIARVKGDTTGGLAKTFKQTPIFFNAINQA